MACSQKCEFGFFESTSCSFKTDRVCKAYQYNAPVGLKYFIACGQVVLVGVVSLVIYKMHLETLQPRTTNRGVILLSLFIGLWDFVSDLTMLCLIEPFNPYFLFWISLGALVISLATSILLASFSRIKTQSDARASWVARVVLFIASCGNLFDSDAGESAALCLTFPPELLNHMSILVIEQAVQIVIQVLLIYLQGIQGFSALDWAIWGQSAFFTSLNAIKNARHIFSSCSNKHRRTESVADAAETQLDATNVILPVTGVGVLSFAASA
jgi:hypothetical protein